jgi:hypothetical protein
MPLSARASATLVSGALVPVLLAGGVASAAGEGTPPPAQSTGALCANVPAGYQPFTDIAGNTFEATVECLARAGVARGGAEGQPADRFVPAAGTTRAAMASLVVRLLDVADANDSGSSIRPLPAFDGSVGFSDVPASSVHAQAVDRLAEAGIVLGDGGRYRPSEVVTRAQMATFVIRSLQFMTGDRFATGTDYFTDDADAPEHQANINAVAAEGIAVGDGRDTFGPRASVRRDQVTGFLARALAVLEADGT